MHSALVTAALIEAMRGFASMLERSGLAVTAQRLAQWVEALRCLTPVSIEALRMTGRATLCDNLESLTVFERCFGDWLRSSYPLEAAKVAESRPRSGGATIRPAGDRSDLGMEREECEDFELPLASADDVLRQRDIASLSADEQKEVQRLLAALNAPAPTRRSNRQMPARRGQIDLRHTIRAALRAGGEITTLHHRRPRLRARRRLLLIDVSGSMSPYADALLRFGFALTRCAPAATEVFTMGTRLTRLTRVWNTQDPERALAVVAQAVPDWHGGTLIGEQLKAFLDRWGHRGLARGAVVVIASDGWETGDATMLSHQMERLSRLSHRTVWCNPHKSSPDYQPIASGIRGALPHIDHFVGGCSVNELEQLVCTMHEASASARSNRPIFSINNKRTQKETRS